MYSEVSYQPISIVGFFQTLKVENMFKKTHIQTLPADLQFAIREQHIPEQAIAEGTIKLRSFHKG